MAEKWKQHFGVYGVYVLDDSLLVVKKTRGPYTNRFDLPGGSLNANESLVSGLSRELQEEVGQNFEIQDLLGIQEYLIPWVIKDATHLHHIAVFFKIQPLEQLRKISVVADDTKGFALIKINELHETNASPLLLDVLKILKGVSIPSTFKKYEDWDYLGD
ncbi:MAG: NUDIX domain-containing protein [Candidatus Woesearchaeota archaeon]